MSFGLESSRARTPEQNLWIAVLALLVTDMIREVNHFNGSNASQVLSNINTLRNHLHSRHIAWVCEMCDLDHSRLCAGMDKKILKDLKLEEGMLDKTHGCRGIKVSTLRPQDATR